jgi:hypothetical protein
MLPYAQEQQRGNAEPERSAHNSVPVTAGNRLQCEQNKKDYIQPVAGQYVEEPRHFLTWVKRIKKLRLAVYNKAFIVCFDYCVFSGAGANKKAVAKRLEALYKK